VTWSTNEIEYKGLPLLLRKPDHKDIWKFQDKFPQLVSVEHHLSETSNDGLPASEYNKTLADFDEYMCGLLENSMDGIVILVETFAGKRNYYYYTKRDFEIKSLVDLVQNKFNVVLTTWQKKDPEWGFLSAYPIEIYSK